MTAFFTFVMNDAVAGASVGVIVGCIMVAPLLWWFSRDKKDKP